MSNGPKPASSVRPEGSASGAEPTPNSKSEGTPEPMSPSGEPSNPQVGGSGGSGGSGSPGSSGSNGSGSGSSETDDPAAKELKKLKDTIDVVTKLKTLKAEVREALQEEEPDAEREVKRASRYLAICVRIKKYEDQVYNLTPDDFHEAYPRR